MYCVSILVAQPTLSSYLRIGVNISPANGSVIDVDPLSGMIYIGGAFSGRMELEAFSLESAGQTDAFVLALNRDLEPQWLEQYGGPGSDGITCLKVLEGTGVLVGMYCGANTANITTYQVGDVVYTGRGNADAVIADLDIEGNVVWSRNDGSYNYEAPNSIDVDNTGRIVVAGSFMTSSLFGSQAVLAPFNTAGYLQVLDENGNHIWIKHTTNLDVDTVESNSSLISVNANTTDGYEVVSEYVGSVIWGDDKLDAPLQSKNSLHALTKSGLALNSKPAAICFSEYAAFTRANKKHSAANSLQSELCTSEKSATLEWLPNPTVKGLEMAEVTSADNEFSIQPLQVSRAPGRACICGTYRGAVDIINYGEPVDAQSIVQQGFTDGFFISFDTILKTKNIVTMLANERAEVHATTITSTGIVALGNGTGVWQTLGSKTGIQEGTLVVMNFNNQASAVHEPEIQLDMEGPWYVYTTAGLLISPHRHTKAQVAELPSGVYYLRSLAGVSLCNVFSPHNIAFSHPTSAPR